MPARSAAIYLARVLPANRERAIDFIRSEIEAARAMVSTPDYWGR